MLENKNKNLTKLEDLGEFNLIDLLTKDLKIRHKSTIKSIGDDAAVLDYKSKKVLVSTDFLVEGVHFDLSYMPLKHLGYKAVMVNLSDIYAMNGIAKHITVSIAISNRFTQEAMEELYAGISLACEKYDVDFVGGDTTSSVTGLTISVTAIGEANLKDIVYRNGAKPNDLIVVSGVTGTVLEPEGTGISWSVDGGETWEYIAQPVDNDQGSAYITKYWNNIAFEQLSITTNVKNVSYDIDVDLEYNYIYATSWAGMLQRFKYTDSNPSWELVPLPMDGQDNLSCDFSCDDSENQSCCDYTTNQSPNQNCDNN